MEEVWDSIAYVHQALAPAAGNTPAQKRLGKDTAARLTARLADVVDRVKDEGTTKRNMKLVESLQRYWAPRAIDALENKGVTF